MTFSLTCTSCGEAISGDSEDDFVDKARAHAEKHGHAGSALSREHILARLGRPRSSPSDPAVLAPSVIRADKHSESS